ncbi:MAG: SGNH/GDSL hydrolase family protein [Xanthobacteraceae bacterium]
MRAERILSQTRLPALAGLAVIAASLAGVQPGSAQGWGGDRYYGGGYGGYRYYRPNPQRDFFYPFSGFMRPPPVADSTKAPATRKLETPPTTTVVVIGDSIADWLAYGLDELYADQPEVGVERKIRAASGLVRYEPKNETLDWSQAIKDALANEKPNAIVVMLGLNDRVAMRDKNPPPPNAKRAGESAQPANQAANQSSGQPAQDKAAAPVDSEAPPQAAAQAEPQRPVPGGSYEFHTDPWAALYAKRIDDMINALKTKGVPIVWVGLPAIRGTKSTSDVGYLDELYRGRAERAGIVYVDIWDGFVDDQGRYAVQGPDFEGQIRRLRTADGVHFTKAGAVKLASYVDHELRRVMSTHIAPLALPAPEAAPKAGTVGTRPDVGPVVPLSANEANGGDLVGAGGHTNPALSDPTAAKVLSRGDPLPAPAGRADDFSWPRPAASAAPEIAPQPASLTPAPVGKSDKKPVDSGKDAKSKPAKESAKDSGKDSSASRSRRPTNADLDGPPIPPAPVGSR